MATMAITADMVKKLRDQTGAGMMECKSALAEANGDFEEANTIVDGRIVEIDILADHHRIERLEITVPPA